MINYFIIQKHIIDYLEIINEFKQDLFEKIEKRFNLICKKIKKIYKKIKKYFKLFIFNIIIRPCKKMRWFFKRTFPKRAKRLNLSL